MAVKSRTALDAATAPLIAQLYGTLEADPTRSTRPLIVDNMLKNAVTISNQSRAPLYTPDFGHGMPEFVTLSPKFQLGVICIMPVHPPSNNLYVAFAKSGAVLGHVCMNKAWASIAETVSLYLALLAARVAFSVLPAYIHPDELFQAPEVAANDIFGLEAVRTWEFDPRAPIRSSVPIYIYAGFPMLLVKVAQRILLALFGYRLELTSQLLFCAPRAFMALLSFLVDASIYDTLKRLNPTARMAPTMILVASSYCLAVFHTHTFSNSFASIILALCFNLLVRIEQACVPAASSSQAEPATHGQLIKLCILFGVCVALGTFGHIAFAAFALPLCLVCAAILVNAVWTDTVGLRYALGAFSGVAVGGIGSLLAITLTDSVYFGSLKVETTGVSGSLTCTLLNNLSYNTKKDNLAEHGIHPWYLHATASMPTLFGPLYILAIAKLWVFAKSSAARAETSYTSAAAALSVVVGVGAMSMVPHQEPRFLLPAFTGM
ncbi:alpha 1,2 mannosyltransferase, partial [Linderina pennispora]